MVNNSSLRAIALVLIVLCWPAYAAEISVRTDRGTIRMNEAFTLTFSAQGRTNGNPDFTPLRHDFEVAGTSQNSSFIITNGQTESSSNWVVTVFPKRTGTLTVPPIAFGSDSSPELQIDVQAGADPGATENKDAFITVETKPGNPYVQAQTIVTVRLYRIPSMANEQLSPLEFSSSDVIVHQLDEQKYPTSLYGQQYNVYEQQYAVFPQQSGLLRIKPLQYSGVRIMQRRGFFDMDPFGSASSQPVRIQSEAVTLDVRPAAAAPWLPAASLKLEEHWSGEPAEFKIGEPLTRKLSITAVGLTAEQLPELPAAAIDGFKHYPDQPSLENRKSETGITGVREESVAFIPTRAGTYTLPAVEIKWWNTKTGKTESARMPERTVTVAPSPDGARAPEPGQQPAPLELQTESDGGSPAFPADSPASPEKPVWLWLSLILGLGWLLTALAWWRQNHGRKARAPETDDRGQVDIGKARSILEQACRQNRADAAKDALLTWARVYWEQHPPQSLDAIAARARHEQFAAQLRALNAHLYAPKSNGSAWDGPALWQAFSEYKKSMSEDSKRKAPSLPPLHKI